MCPPTNHIIFKNELDSQHTHHIHGWRPPPATAPETKKNITKNNYVKSTLKWTTLKTILKNGSNKQSTVTKWLTGKHRSFIMLNRYLTYLCTSWFEVWLLRATSVLNHSLSNMEGAHKAPQSLRVEAACRLHTWAYWLVYRSHLIG